MTGSISAPTNPLPRGMLALLDSQVLTVRQKSVQFVQKPPPAPVSTAPAAPHTPDPAAVRGSRLDIKV